MTGYLHMMLDEKLGKITPRKIKLISLNNSGRLPIKAAGNARA